MGRIRTWPVSGVYWRGSPIAHRFDRSGVPRSRRLLGGSGDVPGNAAFWPSESSASLAEDIACQTGGCARRVSESPRPRALPAIAPTVARVTDSAVYGEPVDSALCAWQTQPDT